MISRRLLVPLLVSVVSLASPCFGLVQVNDQNIIRKLPSNCYTLGSDGAIAITHTAADRIR